MAIVVPFLIANTAIGAAAAAAIGVGVGTLATITTVAFAVTGVNDKINKAAASVFGEDLVKVANIAGMAYGAFNSGFSLGDGTSNLPIDTAASAGDYVNQMDAASDAVTASNAANAAETGSFLSRYPAPDPTVAGAITEQAATAGLSVPDAVPGEALSPEVQSLANRYPQPLEIAAPVDSTIQQSAGASGANATASMSSSDRAFLNSNVGYTGNASDPGGSFFSKMLIDPKTGNISNGALMAGGNIIQGTFGGYSAAKAREQQQAQYQEQMARQARLANLGTAGWRQTQ